MPSYTLLSVAELAQQPYRSIVRVEVRWSNGQNTVGSGVLVGANDVLTAAHIFGAPDGATIRDVLVYPAYYYGPSSSSAPPVVHAANWTSLSPPITGGSISLQAVRGDLCVVSLPDAIGLGLGYWRIGAKFSGGTASTVGYPGTLNGAPAVSTGWVGTLPTLQYGALDIGALYAQPGSSGGPIFTLDPAQVPVVLGVLSTGSWAVNITAGTAGSADLAWVRQQITLDNLDAAASLPRVSLPAAVVSLGHGVTSLTVHYPVTLSFALGVDTTLSCVLVSAKGQGIGSAQLKIPAGSLQTSVDLPVPVPQTSAPVSQSWGLAFSGADNALFSAADGTAVLAKQAPLAVVGSTASGQVGGCDLPESVVLSDSDDAYRGRGGDDQIDGGRGVDTAFYSGPRADYVARPLGPGRGWVVSPSPSAAVMSRGDGTDTVLNVERLGFPDVRLALDLSGHAGAVARVLGAVLGPDSTKDRALVGLGLGFLDAGGTQQELVGLALARALGPTFGSEQELALLYKNLFKNPPTAADLKYWGGKIESGELTQVSLAYLAAQSEINAANINLVGLAQAGLEYS